ncbi:hypothetical protein CRUP_032844 [Coryphaenoides rupestris]|nr:hypothetical protein CRUP_032844 [Coryphaenoides rupestris]
MMQCFHFMVEPAKNITAKLKESRKRARDEKLEPLEENQLFVVDLARDLSRVCQRSGVLEQVWSQEDTWPVVLCKAFILEWAFMLESKKKPMQSDGWPEMPELSEQELNDEQILQQAKTIILNWTKDLRAQPEEKIPQQWFIWKQRTQKIGAVRYIPHSMEVTLDLNTANPDLLITGNDKRMRCGFQRSDVANLHQRFDGWWCATGSEGYASGRRYWEVEVGERDWRLGVVREAALRKGFKSLNTDTGYLSLRLERGSELKALTLSFYDADAHAHIYTYNEDFSDGEKLFPLFGTVEIVEDLVIRAPVVRSSCICPSVSCIWA